MRRSLAALESVFSGELVAPSELNRVIWDKDSNIPRLYNSNVKPTPELLSALYEAENMRFREISPDIIWPSSIRSTILVDGPPMEGDLYYIITCHARIRDNWGLDAAIQLSHRIGRHLMLVLVGSIFNRDRVEALGKSLEGIAGVLVVKDSRGIAIATVIERDPGLVIIDRSHSSWELYNWQCPVYVVDHDYMLPECDRAAIRELFPKIVGEFQTHWPDFSRVNLWVHSGGTDTEFESQAWARVDSSLKCENRQEFISSLGDIAALINTGVISVRSLLHFYFSSLRAKKLPFTHWKLVTDALLYSRER